MRTTLNIDDDILASARSLASASGRSLGAVVSDLARRGLGSGDVLEEEGFPTFRISRDSPIVTPERIKEALDEGW